MRVALIEDHLMIRDVLRRTCQERFGHAVVAECDRGSQAAAAVRRHEADLAILDLHLPDCDGLPLIPQLRLARPGIRILILSSRCDSFTAYRLERALVAGFVDKNSQTMEMMGVALTAIADGKTYFSPPYWAARRTRLEDPRSFDKLLSDREQEVLACLGDCLTDGEIATWLNISPETAAKHRFNMLRKLSLATTPSLMRYAQANGFHRARLAVPTHPPAS